MKKVIQAETEQLGHFEIHVLEKGNSVWFVASADGYTLGLVCAEITEDSIYFRSDYVEPEYRNMGLYNELFTHRFTWALAKNFDRIKAYVTDMSKSTFERFGFKEAKDRRLIGYTWMEYPGELADGLALE